ncbi:scabin-related ADP-ribosyltransferase [Glaciimonas sp. GNP009]
MLNIMKKISLFCLSSVAVLCSFSPPLSAQTLGDIDVPYVVPEECLPVKGKEPIWATDAIKEQRYYQDWLKATTTICVDLTAAPGHNAVNNPSGEDLPMVWRNDKRWQLRAIKSHVNPDDIFQKGDIPGKTVDGNLTLEPFYHGISGKESALKSTTYSSSVTSFYGDMLYMIDAPGGINVNNTLPKYSGDHFTNEIAFPGGFKRQFIRGVFSVPERVSNGSKHSNNFTKYQANPYYAKFDPTPLGKVDVATTAEGPFGHELTLQVNRPATRSDGYPIYRIAGTDTVTISALDSHGKFRNVSWMVNGTNAHVNLNNYGHCLNLPASMQVDGNIVVTAVDNSQEAATGEAACVEVERHLVDDGKFLEHPINKEDPGVVVVGNFGSWEALKAVTLYTDKIIGKSLPGNTRAVMLNSTRANGGEAGVIEGSVKALDESRRGNLKISFYAGNNVMPKCGKGLALGGDQTFMLEAFDRAGTIIASKAFNIGSANKNSSHYLTPNWRPLEMIFEPSNEDMKLRFTSTSEGAFACGSMITDVHGFVRGHF